MSSRKSGSYLSGGQSSSDNDDQDGQQYYEATGGKKRQSSRLQKSSKQADEDAAEDDYRQTYTAPGNADADDNRYTRNGTGGNGYPCYNLPPLCWAPQDGTRLPIIIQTKEVNMYGAPPGYDNDGYSDQRRRNGGGGFFEPAFCAVGHLVDRKFGLHDSVDRKRDTD